MCDPPRTPSGRWRRCRINHGGSRLRHTYLSCRG
ncbi:hypothetical protein [Rhodoglobus sp.]